MMQLLYLEDNELDWPCLIASSVTNANQFASSWLVLTLSRSEIWTDVVWTDGTYGNIFGSILKLEKYLKESCWLTSDQYFFFK